MFWSRFGLCLIHSFIRISFKSQQSSKGALAAFTLVWAALAHRLLELPSKWTASSCPCLPAVCPPCSAQSDPVSVWERAQNSSAQNPPIVPHLAQNKSPNLQSPRGPSSSAPCLAAIGSHPCSPQLPCSLSLFPSFLQPFLQSSQGALPLPPYLVSYPSDFLSSSSQLYFWDTFNHVM